MSKCEFESRRTVLAWFRGSSRVAAILTVMVVLGVAPVALAAGGDEHAADDHAADDHAGHADDSHGGEHGGHHEFNWYYGFLGEDAEAEHPSVAFRTPGMPVPFLAYLINSTLLFFILYKYGKGPIMDGLKSRRQTILKGMDQASKMKAEAQQQLNDYRAKLDGIEAEVERIRKELREAAEAEREHILAEARGRRERMEREAKLLIEQELKAAHEALVKDTVRSAVSSARELITSHLSSADHQRLGDEYLQSLDASLQSISGGAS